MSKCSYTVGQALEPGTLSCGFSKQADLLSNLRASLKCTKKESNYLGTKIKCICLPSIFFVFFCHGVILLIEANEPMRSVSESFRNTHLENTGHRILS